MPLFKSLREKRLWLLALMVLLLIFSTLFVGQPLLEYFGDQNLRAIIFLTVMILIGAAILFHALKTRPSRIEIAIWLGMAAIFIMFFLRLGMPERSHLIEYAVLAILIHKAIDERIGREKQILIPALIAIVITFLIGVLDECIQIFLPDRVFDIQDILFNGMVVSMAIGFRLVFTWVRKHFSKK